MDPAIIVFGLGIGVLVGMTGMGGGSLMTPLLILIFGILPRFAALVLLCDMIGALATAGRIDGGPHLILPPLLGVLCLILLIAGGGRWALVDRLDPAPPRQLIRTR